MKKRTVRRLGTLVLASIMLSCVSPSVGLAEGDENISTEIVQNFTDVSNFTFGTIDLDSIDFASHLDNDLQNFFAHKLDANDSSIRINSINTSLPSSIDLSERSYFPPIGDQGTDIGSCSAFATTYYQFTYEMNKLNNISSKSEANIFSPSWPYYYLVEDNTEGISLADAYNFLQAHGGVSLSVLDYDPTKFDTEYKMPEVNDRLNALNYDLFNYYVLEVPSANTPITSPTSDALSDIKQILSLGTMFVVSTYYDYDFKWVNNERINYRCKYNADRPHALTVVGYDDNITCDVNGNGTIESGERGAFKIANSWGEGWGNGGFEWILYDALNEVSNIGGAWENSCTGQRQPAFEMASPESNDPDLINNKFVYIVVSNSKPNLIFQLDYTNTMRSSVNVSLRKTQGSSTNFGNGITPRNHHVDSFTLLFDCHELEDNLEADTVNTEWKVQIYGTAYPTSGKLIDNRGNTIKSLTEIPINVYSASINLIRGDLNYSNELNNADSTLLIRYCSGYDNLSNVQIFLADYNEDGTVDSKDSAALLRYLSENS